MRYALLVPFRSDEKSKTGYSKDFEIYKRFTTLKAARAYQAYNQFEYCRIVRLIDKFGKDGRTIRRDK
jgi:hypothetical protein